MTSEQLSELVLGRGLQLFQRARKSFAQVKTGVSIKNVRSDRLSLDQLDIHRGEILGFTGLPGAGAKELARSLFGLVPVDSGTIQFDGDAAPSKLPRDPKAAFETGIAFLSDDRRKDGAVTQMSIGQNISLSSLDAVSRNGFLQPAKERELSNRYFASMGIKAAGPEAVVDTLSGGNQQKVCLGRVMATNPRLLILDEPTRGIDVGVKQDVLAIIDALSEQGVCVIIVSTDTDELARATDRVCIFAGGKIHTQLVGDDIETEKLRKLMGVA